MNQSGKTQGKIRIESVGKNEGIDSVREKLRELNQSGKNQGKIRELVQSWKNEGI